MGKTCDQYSTLHNSVNTLSKSRQFSYVSTFCRKYEKKNGTGNHRPDVNNGENDISTVITS